MRRDDIVQIGSRQWVQQRLMNAKFTNGVCQQVRLLIRGTLPSTGIINDELKGSQSYPSLLLASTSTRMQARGGSRKFRKGWPGHLRAPVCKHGEFAVKTEISKYFIFSQEKPFGETFSKITIKVSKGFSFSRKPRKIEMLPHTI